jgi:hypothetical protein
MNIDGLHRPHATTPRGWRPAALMANGRCGLLGLGLFVLGLGWLLP